MNQSNSDLILHLLKEFQASAPDVEAVILVMGDGVVLYSSWPATIDSEHLAALLAASIASGSMLLDATSQVALKYSQFECQDGSVFAVPLMHEYVLAILTHKFPKAGFIMQDVRRIFLTRAFAPILPWQPPGYLNAGADFD